MVKVFGERNCGTNLAQQVLASDPGVRVLAAGAPRVVRRAAQRAGSRRETVLDAWDDVARRRTLGWKHAYVDAAAEQRVRARGIAALALTKHPLSWLVSIRANSYHLTTGPTGSPRPQHLKRERLPRPAVDLLDVWELKTARYCDLHDAGVLRLLRFEDVVAEPAEVLGRALRELGHDVGPLRVPSASVKPDARTTDEIRAHYRREVWRPDVTEADLERADRIDTALLDRLDYAVRATSGGGAP